MGPHPAVAAVRLAVRRCLAGQDPGGDPAIGGKPAVGADPAGAGGRGPGGLVLVACSGGADSLALAAAVAFEAPKTGLRAGGVVIDHGLQAGSAAVAASVLATMAGLGLDPQLSVGVSVAGPGDQPGYPGPEAAAREARYAALEKAAAETGAKAILLGHTLDDQAETVLLGLARGSGARSLAGMPASTGRYLRPLLGLRRAETRAACAALGLKPWDDPQNADDAFSRARVRHELLPQLEAALGPGVAEGLARTAKLLRADADVLDELARAGALQIQAGQTQAADRACDGENDTAAAGWPVADLAAQPTAIRRRILRAAAVTAGCPPGALAERHIAGIDALVMGWHGQKWTDLPGGIRCERRYGRLHFTAAARSEDPGGRR